MAKILVRGSRKPLIGKININGSKNSVLPIIAASLLTRSPVTLYNVPDLTDVHIMCDLLESLGAEVSFIRNRDYEGNHCLKIDCSNVNDFTIEHQAASELRASVLLLGPLLSRFGKVSTVYPGGCKIGKRPIDFHIKALEEMGGIIETDSCKISARTREGKLQGRDIDIEFEKVSVGATQNIIMAATLAEGVTTIKNAAFEPEVIDLIHFLKKMGASIEIDDRVIGITGVEELTGCSHRIIPDRIEAGTYALAAAMTNGRLELEGINVSGIREIADELETVGCEIESLENGMIISRRSGSLRSVEITTSSYPNFPTDMQAPFMSAMCTAEGTSVIEENVYENRFTHVKELRKMGARISVNKNKAVIHGVKRLHGATELRATDLRAAAALVLASLTASGETLIHQCDYLMRGYEAMPEKLRSCGADVHLEFSD